MKTFIALVTFLLILSGKVAFAPEASKVSPQKHFGTLTTVAVLSEKDIKTPDRQCFKRDSGLIGAIGDTVQLEYGPDETGISNWAILRHNAGEPFTVDSVKSSLYRKGVIVKIENVK